HDKMKELTLMLLYLNSWEENEHGTKYRRSWKGYDFDVLNELSDDDLIIDGKHSKSCALSNDGIAKALMLLKEYNINLSDGDES
ncbi:MAG: DUF6429 family protein, partial [Eubacteriales bacterium]